MWISLAMLMKCNEMSRLKTVLAMEMIITFIILFDLLFLHRIKITKLGRAG